MLLQLSDIDRQTRLEGPSLLLFVAASHQQRHGFRVFHPPLLRPLKIYFEVHTTYMINITVIGTLISFIHDVPARYCMYEYYTAVIISVCVYFRFLLLVLQFSIEKASKQSRQQHAHVYKYDRAYSSTYLCILYNAATQPFNPTNLSKYVCVRVSTVARLIPKKERVQFPLSTSV